MRHAISHRLAQARRVRRRPSPRTVLAIASLGAAVAFIDATIVNIAFPDIARSFPGTPIVTLSWVLNAYGIVPGSLGWALTSGQEAYLGVRRTLYLDYASAACRPGATDQRGGGAERLRRPSFPNSAEV